MSGSKIRGGLIAAGLGLGFIGGCVIMVLLADEIYENFRIPAGWTPTILLDEDNAMRELIRSGAILSPNELIETLEAEMDGRVTDIDFDRGFLRDHYEFELIDAEQREWDIEVDAENGDIINRRRDWN